MEKEEKVFSSGTAGVCCAPCQVPPTLNRLVDGIRVAPLEIFFLKALEKKPTRMNTVCQHFSLNKKASMC